MSHLNLNNFSKKFKGYRCELGQMEIFEWSNGGSIEIMSTAFLIMWNLRILGVDWKVDIKGLSDVPVSRNLNKTVSKFYQNEYM